VTTIRKNFSSRIRRFSQACAVGTRIISVSIATLSLLWGPFVPAFASDNTLPSGGVVESGNISINAVSDSHLKIDQLTESGIINWREFSVGNSARVEFAQPSSSSSTLNRVSGGHLTRGLKWKNCLMAAQTRHVLNSLPRIPAN